MKPLASAISSLFVSILLPLCADAHCGGRHGPNHLHCAEEDPPTEPELTSCPGIFPAFVFAVETRNKRGHTTRSDLKVSNANGNCSIDVHSVSNATTYDDLTFSYDANSDKYRIAYNYESDEADPKKGPTGPNIRVVDFSVSPHLGETKINEALPLAVQKIYKNTETGAIFGMDLLGNSLVFAEIDAGLPERFKIRIIEDVGRCLATIGPQPDESCASAPVFEFASSAPDDRPGAILPKWGLDTSRIYFEFQAYGPGGDEHVIAFIDRIGTSSWSNVGAIRDLAPWQADFYNGNVSSWDHDASGPSEVVASTIGGFLQLLDVDVNCTAVVSATTTCLSLGLATIINLETAAPHGRWTSYATLDSVPPNLLFFDNGGLNELDPDSGSESQIINEPHTGAWFFDPVE